MLKTFKKSSSQRVPSGCSQSRYIGDIYLHKKTYKAFLSHGWNSAEVGWWLLPGYCFEVRAEWLEERKSEISCMYYNNSMTWNMLQHCDKYQNNQDLNSVTEWVWYIAIYLSLPSGSDISRYILPCRASTIHGLPINLRYIYKRVSSLIVMVI